MPSVLARWVAAREAASAAATPRPNRPARVRSLSATRPAQAYGPSSLLRGHLARSRNIAAGPQDQELTKYTVVAATFAPAFLSVPQRSSCRQQHRSNSNTRLSDCRTAWMSEGGTSSANVWWPNHPRTPTRTLTDPARQEQPENFTPTPDRPFDSANPARTVTNHASEPLESVMPRPCCYPQRPLGLAGPRTR